MELTNIADIHPDDEIYIHIRGRYMCSMDAMWRTYGFQTYPSSSPLVVSVQVKTKDQVQFYQRNGKLTDLLVYFNRPACLQHLKYTELFAKYVTASQRSAKFCDDDEDDKYFILQVPHIGNDVYLQLRDKFVLCRMEMLYPTSGEPWYLRVILLNKPCASFQDAQTVNGNLCSSFQQAAVRLGLVDDEREATLCFNEACAFKTPPELRSLFAFMTVQGFPTQHLYHNPTTFGSLVEDYYINRNIIQSTASYQQHFLRELHDLLAEHGHSLSDYGFPTPTDISTELQREQLRYGI